MNIQYPLISDWMQKFSLLESREALVCLLATKLRDLCKQEYFELLEVHRLGDRKTHLRLWDGGNSFKEFEAEASSSKILLWQSYFLKMEKELLDLKSGMFELAIDDKNPNLCFFVGLGNPQFYIFSLSSKIFNKEERSLFQLLVLHVQSVAQLLYKVDQTQNLLFKDDLTGLYNHRYLESVLDQEVKRSQRFQTGFCLLFMDVDNFKKINDQFGHPTGSYVLKQVADLLRDTLREVDSIMRYGGDEFVILLLGATSASAFLAAERIRSNVEKKVFNTETNEGIRITTSIGVAAFPEHAKTAAELLKLADTHMYQSKKSGKNKVTGFTISES